MKSACLAVDSPDGRGWRDLDVPASDLLDPLESSTPSRSWRRDSGRYIYKLNKVDPLTGKTSRMGFELVDAGQYSTQICGPSRVVVRRIQMDQYELAGWEVMMSLPTFLQAAAEARAKTSVTAEPSSRPPIGAHAAPIPMTTTPPVVTPAAAPYVPPPQAPASVADAEEGYSSAYRDCRSSGGAANGVTVDLLACDAAELERQDTRLNREYRSAMARLDPARAAALRVEERAWIKARDAKCRGVMGDEAEGTLGRVIYSQCILRETTARSAYVSSYR